MVADAREREPSVMIAGLIGRRCRYGAKRAKRRVAWISKVRDRELSGGDAMRCDAMRLAARAHLGSQLVANVNVPVRLAAWSRASFSWLRTMLNEGDAEAETERKRQEERSRRRCGGKNRSRRLASSDDLQNEPRRQRAATMAGPLSLPLSLGRERLRRLGAQKSCTQQQHSPLLRAAPDWVARRDVVCCCALCCAACAALQF